MIPKIEDTVKYPTAQLVRKMADDAKWILLKRDSVWTDTTPSRCYLYHAIWLTKEGNTVDLWLQTKEAL